MDQKNLDLHSYNVVTSSVVLGLFFNLVCMSPLIWEVPISVLSMDQLQFVM
jgi:hypothetical protein